MSISVQALQGRAIETLQYIRWPIWKSENAARPVELIDAGPWAFAERERAKLVAVESLRRGRRLTRLDTQSVQLVPDLRGRSDAVRQLVRVSLAIEEQFPATVCHENIFPLIGDHHDLEIVRSGRFDHTYKIFTRRAFASQHLQNVNSLPHLAFARSLGSDSK